MFSNCRKANKRDLPGVSVSCTGCEEETILAICNKVSVMPPDCCASLRNLRLVHYSKHLGNGVLQFFGIRPPKMSPPFILEMTALSNPNAWQTSSLPWRLRMLNVVADMWRSVRISVCSSSSETFEIKYFPNLLMISGSVLDCR